MTKLEKILKDSIEEQLTCCVNDGKNEVSTLLVDDEDNGVNKEDVFKSPEGLLKILKSYSTEMEVVSIIVSTNGNCYTVFDCDLFIEKLEKEYGND